MLWGVLGIPGAIFNVYCEQWSLTQPMAQNIPLWDLGIGESAVFLFESLVPVQTHFPFEYLKPAPETTTNYYAKVRPGGDLNAAQYLERKLPQYEIGVFRLSDPAQQVATISGPEAMPVTEIPELILLAVKDAFDPKRDTMQVFRRRVNGDGNDLVASPLRPDILLKHFLVSDARTGDYRVYYDIVRGFAQEQLRHMVVRTCDVFDGPCHRLSRIRYPMRPSDPLQLLTQYIQREVYPCPHGRLLLDEDGLIRPIGIAEVVTEAALLRFDVVPPDQVALRNGEFLVVAILCRDSKGLGGATSLGKSFMFRIIPGEPADAAAARVGQLNLFHPKLLPTLTFRASQRILNGDETLDPLLRPNDHLRVILPDRGKAIILLKKAGVEVDEEVAPYD
jgi:hypothetical protein